MVEHYPPLFVPPKRSLKHPLVRPFYPDPSCVLCLLPEFNSTWIDQSLTGSIQTHTDVTEVSSIRRSRALSFNGASSLIETDVNIDSMIPDTSSFSCEVWVKCSNPTEDRIIFGKATAPRFYLKDNTDGLFGLGNKYTAMTGMVYSTNWAHVVIVYDHPNTNLYGYIDGVEKSSVDYEGDANIPTNPLYIGSAKTSNWFTGLIDEFRLWNRMLKPWEIKALYEQGKQ